ncbi:MAG: hypothetical protein AB8B55_20120 [Mariniblastus sp.]
MSIILTNSGWLLGSDDKCAIGYAQEQQDIEESKHADSNDDTARLSSTDAELQNAVLTLKVNEKGPLSRVTKDVKPILRLKINENDSFLSVDRSAWESKKLTKAEKVEAAIASLMDRGLDRKTAEKFAERMTDVNRTSPLESLFTKIRISGGMTSQGRNISGSNTKWSSESSEMTCQLNSSSDLHLFQLTELADPGRTLIFRQSGKSLSILLIGFDWSISLRQIQGKKLNAWLITSDHVTRGSGNDFVDFSTKHPDLCRRVLDSLSKSGIDVPPIPNSGKVSDYVVRMIQQRSSLDKLRLDELIEKLDASEFKVRERASKEISESFQQFESGIAGQLATGELSIEARKRLREITKAKTKAKKSDPRVLRCAEVFQLGRSPKYIASLLKNRSPDVQQVLMKHLAEVTEEKFGDNAQAWLEWAETTTEGK